MTRKEKDHNTSTQTAKMANKSMARPYDVKQDTQWCGFSVINLNSATFHQNMSFGRKLAQNE